jgi:hypothetical protein
VLREWRVEPRAGDGGPLGKPGGMALARGGHMGLLAWGYTTDRLGNLEFDIIGAADSLTGDVMLIVVVVIAIVILLFACIGVVGYELLEDGNTVIVP